MGKCEDCRHWKNIAETHMGHCSGLTVKNANSDGFQQVVPMCCNDLKNVETWKEFGCSHFDEKRKGPFTVRKGNEQHYNIMFMGSFGPKFGTKWHAQEMCDWLNDLWPKPEQEKKCSTCRWFDSSCLKCRSPYFFHPAKTSPDHVCGGWSPK